MNWFIIQSVMNNSQMIPNRFGRWAKARRINRQIAETFAKGGTVFICTMTRVVEYKPKHAAMFKATKTGAWVQRGKSWDCIDLAGIVARFPTGDVRIN